MKKYIEPSNFSDSATRSTKLVVVTPSKSQQNSLSGIRQISTLSACTPSLVLGLDVLVLVFVFSCFSRNRLFAAFGRVSSSSTPSPAVVRLHLDRFDLSSSSSLVLELKGKISEPLLLRSSGSRSRTKVAHNCMYVISARAIPES